MPLSDFIDAIRKDTSLRVQVLYFPDRLADQYKLSKEEVERAPAAGLVAGSLGRGFAGGRRGQVQAGPSPTDLNADDKGNVTKAGLAAYYRKNGVLKRLKSVD